MPLIDACNPRVQAPGISCLKDLRNVEIDFKRRKYLQQPQALINKKKNETEPISKQEEFNKFFYFFINKIIYMFSNNSRYNINIGKNNIRREIIHSTE